MFAVLNFVVSILWALRADKVTARQPPSSLLFIANKPTIGENDKMTFGAAQDDKQKGWVFVTEEEGFNVLTARYETVMYSADQGYQYIDEES